MSRASLMVAAAAFIAAALYSRSAKAAGVYIDASGEAMPDVDPVELPRDTLAVDDWTPGAPMLDYGWDSFQFEPSAMTDAAKRVDAFLYAIRASEHLAKDVVSGAAYNTYYGGSTFTNMADHPVNTGEKVGVPLPREWCIRLGYSGGKCVSTAAGAYQFTRPTWNELREMSPRLPDFGQASQDEAARRLLAKIGALPLIERGDYAQAVRIASSRWASLPDSTAGQGGRSPEFVLAKINEFLAFA